MGWLRRAGSFIDLLRSNEELVEVREVEQVFNVHLAAARECLLRGADEAGALPG